MSPESDPTPSTPVADPPVAEAASSPPESTAPSGNERPELRSIEDAVRASYAKKAAAVSGASEQPSADADESTASAKSAPEASGDVRPDGQPPGPGRRSKEAHANLDRIADLERQLADRDPEKIRQQIADEAAAAATASDDAAKAQAEGERFLRLKDLPTDHPLLNEVEDEKPNWQWIDEQRAIRLNYPKAEKAIRTQVMAEADARIKTESDALTQAWDNIKGQMFRAGAKRGVDMVAYRDLRDFEAMNDFIVEKAVSDTEARVRGELEPKLDAALQAARDAKAELSRHARLNGSRGLGSVREPLAGGRSGANGAPQRPDFHDATADDLFAFGHRVQSERAAS